MIKPRLYWRFYPKSRRGFWCVSLTPKPYNANVEQYRMAHRMASYMNDAVQRRLAYRAEYAEQRRLRMTT